jgi:hypothetical protein
MLSERAKMNSPQAIRNERAATVISPGRISGSTIRQKAPKRVLPSTIEAASSSRGTERKKGRRMMTAKGSVTVTSARIRAGKELIRLIRLKSTKSGPATTMPGSN